MRTIATTARLSSGTADSRGWTFSVVSLLLFILIPQARAHDPGLSTASVRVEAGRLEAQLTFANADVAVLLGVSPAEAKSVATFPPARLEALARASIELVADSRKLPAEAPKIQKDDQGNIHFQMRFRDLAAGPAVLRCGLIERLPLGHRQFVSVKNAQGITIGEYLVDAGRNEIDLDLAGAAADSRQRVSSFGGFLAMGVHHILTGYDHLLFLFALLLVSRGALATVKVITCFTIAHSLTLAAATLNLVPIQSRVVEPIIAASIVYVGIENLVTRGEPKWRGALTFTFGLVHGLGFASVLRDMGVGADGSGVVVPLLSFNLGVELGQIAVAAIALPLIWWARRWPKFAGQMVPACSAAVVLAGGIWVVERTFHLRLLQ